MVELMHRLVFSSQKFGVKLALTRESWREFATLNEKVNKEST